MKAGKINAQEVRRLYQELMLWNCRGLSSPWEARRSNHSVLKEINSEYSLEGWMLKLQYFGHLMPTASSLEKILMLGKVEHRRAWGERG